MDSEESRVGQRPPQSSSLAQFGARYEYSDGRERLAGGHPSNERGVGREPTVLERFENVFGPVTKRKLFGLGVGVLLIIAIALAIYLSVKYNASSGDGSSDEDRSDVDTTSVIKSSNDPREYLTYSLSQNGLRVLLISDPECDKAGAALSVRTGSMSDPKEAQGLAHFLEHMLFMGSQKYPGENEYSKYMSQHGGLQNAYTAEDETNYFFAVNPDALQTGLDMFANFFVKPLLKKNSLEREMIAVDSEHNKNRQNDGWRVWQVYHELAGKESPFNHFGTGNVGTLNQTGIRDKLVDFFVQHYNPSNMRLVVLGKEPITALQTFANTSFSPIPIARKASDFAVLSPTSESSRDSSGNNTGDVADDITDGDTAFLDYFRPVLHQTGGNPAGSTYVSTKSVGQSKSLTLAW